MIKLAGLVVWGVVLGLGVGVAHAEPERERDSRKVCAAALVASEKVLDISQDAITAAGRSDDVRMAELILQARKARATLDRLTARCLGQDLPTETVDPISTGANA